MREIKIHAYTFEELSEGAQEKAIQYFSNINVEHGWWDFIYDEAKSYGINITGFNQYYNVDATFKISALWTAGKIHEECEGGELRELANSYLLKRTELGDDIDDEELMEMNDLFLDAIREEYGKSLGEEYEYQTSRAAIITTINVNNYEFRIGGELL